MVAVSRHLCGRVAVRLTLRKVRRVVQEMDEERPAAATLPRLQQVLAKPARIEVPFDLRFLVRLLPELLEGAKVTVELALLTMAICLVWGLLVALAQSAKGPLSWLAGAYVQLVRNTPLLIQMYLVYFGFSMAGFGLSGFASGLLALCAQNGGYVAEIYRGGLQSVSIRQFEAGRALGMRRRTLYTTVILPQVVAPGIPPLTNPHIPILTDTSH